MLGLSRGPTKQRLHRDQRPSPSRDAVSSRPRRLRLGIGRVFHLLDQLLLDRAGVTAEQ